MSIFKVIFLSSVLCISCNQKSNDTIKESFEKNDSQTKSSQFSKLDNIVISKIPFGNKMLVDNFTKIGSDFEVSEDENSLLENSDSKFLLSYRTFFDNAKIPLDGFYKFPQKNILDFGFNYVQPIDSISTYQGFYAITKHLPDVNKNKIFIVNSIQKNGEKNNIIDCIDLVVVNSNNQIIDNLNLSHSLNIINEKYNNKYDDYNKYFYIDSDYIIHIKYFTGWGDAMRRVFAYVKYKIQKDGSIIRYFTEEQDHYKSEVEEGEIKNHSKDGIWKEALSNLETNYILKNYQNGKVIDKIEIININGEGEKKSFFINKDTYLPLKK
ncbi:hypothetical protein OIU83_04675 [Flavobacterium sp. LS1R49]|uniref:Uncharacterized protein n=1 Tax=Flavobacterium shii TaxID=2987687 RepID=A0A9X2ZAV2_9FLAO|nr:hypothetical protein [Flavobacterium shii]MCV9926930.1 hypothetical protein [Flavobacterium shii]